MNETLNALSNFFNDFNVPNGVYYAMLLATTISLILQRAKKWLEIQSDRVINFLGLALSFVGVAIDSLLSEASSNPSILGQRTLLVVGVIQLMYQFVIKPGHNLIRDAKATRQARDESTVVTTVFPATTAPVTTIETPAVDEFGV